ncbi:MAG: hypothetical protein LBV23_03180 [Deltaproteobacteria bacterium]|jgi:hypothetical protein|nr:hypothetical protein [Deltaproteobacteria bacterium]
MENENTIKSASVLELDDEDIVIEFLGEISEKEESEVLKRPARLQTYRSIVDEFFKLNPNVGALSISPSFSYERGRVNAPKNRA